MQMPHLRAFMTMLPRLQAREALRAAAVATMGNSRRYDKAGARRVISEWDKQAGDGGSGRRLDFSKMTPGQRNAVVAGMGFEVRTFKPAAPAEGTP